jgi:enamine deaminase RidA (YjgF/YER057c/UK114 family)
MQCRKNTQIRIRSSEVWSTVFLRSSPPKAARQSTFRVKLPGTHKEQARQALRNVQAAVEAVGGTLADVVALRIYIVNYRPEQADAVGGALREFFPKEERPASTWIGVSALAVSDFLIEIEATAVLE